VLIVGLSPLTGRAVAEPAVPEWRWADAKAPSLHPGLHDVESSLDPIRRSRVGDSQHWP
jgi:hypothetical protein